MNNFYYLIFYMIANFARKINKREKDYTFSSLIFLSLCMGLNALSIVFLLRAFTSIQINIKGIVIIIAAIVFFVNYLLLMRNKKDEKIIDFYDREYQNKKVSSSIIFWVVAYVVFSYSFCIFSTSLAKGTT